MTAAAVLERAIEEKKAHPHAQYVFTGIGGGICLYEALARGAGTTGLVASFPKSQVCTGRYSTVSRAEPKAMVDAMDALGLDSNTICEFNNSHTKEECVAKLEQGLAELVSA